MATQDQDPPKPPQAQSDREARLARALRENLKRRKAQARARQGEAARAGKKEDR